MILGSAVCLAGVALVRRLGPVAWLVVIGLIAFFLMSNYSTDRGQRWVNPFLDVIGKRILTDQDRLAGMARLGMPVLGQVAGRGRPLGQADSDEPGLRFSGMGPGKG